MTGLRPFQVSQEQVARVGGGGFATLINQLLTVEARRAGLRQHQLQLDYRDDVADGGVDAALRADVGTEWLPEGVSAWQFKSSDRTPAKCRAELRKAVWARELLAAGATYTLVLGGALTPQLVNRRKDALVAEAKDLELPSDPDLFRVYDANKLADWLSEFPALSVHRLLGGAGGVAVDFGSWQSWYWHRRFSWTSSAERDAEIAQIRAGLDAATPVGLRVSGESGIGKSRLVMEALRGTAWEPLVAYVPAADELEPAFLAHVFDPIRTVLLIVDECDSHRHEKIVERVPAGALARIITIGQDEAEPLSAPVLTPQPLPDDAIDAFLASNWSALPVEGRRFVAAHASGNVRFAVLLTERLLAHPEATAAELIRRDDFTALTGVLLPEGRPFFVAAVLALFERVGWDRELESERNVVAQFAGVTAAELDAVAAELEDRGLLIRQGRYRAIAPHPVAVLLAADAWRRHGNRVVTDLLPQLPPDLALALLTRVTHLGSYPPAQEALRQLLASGVLGSLQDLETSGRGAFVIRLAVVLPDEVSAHLYRLIMQTPVDVLRQHTSSRRDLVWTLEKLVWHSRLFEQAAESLLRLALAENETYANNATGLWTSLFAALLPRTAAPPADRLSYLRRTSVDSDPAVQGLALEAAKAALHPHESAVVSGELQGGSPVEPRGGVRTEEEFWAFRAALVDVLAQLYRTGDPQLAPRAAEALISGVRPLVDRPIVGPALQAALADLRPDDLPALRREIAGLRSLFTRRDNPDVQAGLDALEAALPPSTSLDLLRTLTDLDPWTLQDDEREPELRAALAAVHEEGQLAQVLHWLADRPVNRGWHLGHALALDLPGEPVLSQLVRSVEHNLPALAGYLQGRLDVGDDQAVRTVLDTPAEAIIPAVTRLALAVRLPPTPDNTRRVRDLIDQVSVADGARRLFGWQREFGTEQVAQLLSNWQPRIADQNDYNAVVDWLAGWFHRRSEVPETLVTDLVELVAARRTYPNLGGDARDWAQLAARLGTVAVPVVTPIVLDMVDSGFLLHDSQPEAALLVQLMTSDPGRVWELVGERLEAGSWRLAMSVRGWLTSSVPVEVLRAWVGGDVERARLLAQVASAGQDQPSPEALYLLTDFGTDMEVLSALAADFASGSWVGPWSGRIRQQLAVLSAWEQPNSPPGARDWAQRMRQQLEHDLVTTLEREAEEGA